MSLLKRAIVQIVIWLGIWTSFWISSGYEPRFLITNGPLFVFQILLILWILYVAVPKFMFSKKYFYFILTTIPIVLLFAFVSSEIAPQPPFERPFFERNRHRPGPIPFRFFIHLLVLFISSVSAVLLETFVLAQKKEKGMALVKAELMESELKFLKMQINPHFLFNALNNIYALSVTNSDKTQEGISTLSLMLRYVLYDCERPKVELKKELEYITHFIDLFKLKSSKEYNINFLNEVEDEAVMVAPMLFVPFIENAFKHSGIEKGGDSFVNISIQTKENTIVFTVENSLPTEPLILDKQGGIGLKNVQKRLEILYPNQHHIVINKKDTFKVDLKLDIK